MNLKINILPDSLSDMTYFWQEAQQIKEDAINTLFQCTSLSDLIYHK